MTCLDYLNQHFQQNFTNIIHPDIVQQQLGLRPAINILHFFHFMEFRKGGTAMTIPIYFSLCYTPFRLINRV